MTEISYTRACRENYYLNHRLWTFLLLHGSHLRSIRKAIMDIRIHQVWSTKEELTDLTIPITIPEQAGRKLESDLIKANGISRQAMLI